MHDIKILVVLLSLVALSAGCTTKPNPSANMDTTVAPTPPPAVPAELVWPISRATERVTKKPFGIKVSPTSSPVSPERFSGYHNAVDFETFPEEQDTNVAINAICNGKILQKRTVSGYGGLLVQACTINGQPVTINYGHVRLSSIVSKIGDALSVGQSFAVLGTGYSSETDGERKHLHLGIHKGTTANVVGYVQTQSALSDWLDLQTLLP